MKGGPQLTISVHEAARIMKCSESTVQRLIQMRQIKAVRNEDGCGRPYAIPLAAFIQFAERLKRSISVAYAAQILGVSDSTVARRIADGRLRSWRYGRWHKIERSALFEYATEPTKERAV